jgi:hypothetical protein
VIAVRNAGLNEEKAAAAVGQVSQRTFGIAEMVEDSIAVHDLKSLIEVQGWYIEIESMYLVIWKPLSQQRDMLSACIRCRDSAAPIDEEACVIANPGADFEHGTSDKRQPERSEMLENSLVVAHIPPRVEIRLRAGPECGYAPNPVCRPLTPSLHQLTQPYAPSW